MKGRGGFTLLELMVTVAIVGILFTICMAVYHEYVVRARVTEGLSIARNARMLIEENAQQRVSPLSTGWTAPSGPVGHVQGIDVALNGEITIRFDPDAGNGTLVLAPRDGQGGAALVAGDALMQSIVWYCNAAGSTHYGTNGTLLGKYAPQNCR